MPNKDVMMFEQIKHGLTKLFNEHKMGELMCRVKTDFTFKYTIQVEVIKKVTADFKLYILFV